LLLAGVMVMLPPKTNEGAGRQQRMFLAATINDETTSGAKWLPPMLC